MSLSDSTAMPIGAVARLTGISTHTLRKWESRYRVIEPVRSDTGRRLYTQDQVTKLVMLRDLVDHGRQISQLSNLSFEELKDLSDRAGETLDTSRPPRLEFDEIFLVGQVLNAIFTAQELNLPAEFSLLSEPAADWLKHAALTAETARTTAGSSATLALVIELPTISEEQIKRLLELKQARFSQILVVYGFTTRAVEQRLNNGGVQCVKAPITAAAILNKLQYADSQPSVRDLLADSSIPKRRFSTESIAQLAAVAPTISCECPNHIAQLLLGISAFEQYSQECEDSDPDERALHGRLRLIASQARALFEEGLENVARAEGIPLEEL